MHEAVTLDQLKSIAAGIALEDPHRESEPAWTIALLTKCADSVKHHCEIVEAGRSGLATYVEGMIGRPSNALAFKRSLLGPFAAVGRGSYSISRPGEVSGWIPLTSDCCDAVESEYVGVATLIRSAAQSAGVQVLSKGELCRAVPSDIAGLADRMYSVSAAKRNGRVTVFDVLFQWTD